MGSLTRQKPPGIRDFRKMLLTMQMQRDIEDLAIVKRAQSLGVAAGAVEFGIDFIIHIGCEGRKVIASVSI